MVRLALAEGDPLSLAKAALGQAMVHPHLACLLNLPGGSGAAMRRSHRLGTTLTGAAGGGMGREGEEVGRKVEDMVKAGGRVVGMVKVGAKVEAKVEDMVKVADMVLVVAMGREDRADKAKEGKEGMAKEDMARANVPHKVATHPPPTVMDEEEQEDTAAGGEDTGDRTKAAKGTIDKQTMHTTQTLPCNLVLCEKLV